MSDRLAAPDPFVPDVLDEATELRALARALSFAEGFTLLFARCNQPSQRQRLIAALRIELPQLTVQEIHFSEPLPHLLDEFRERITSPPPDALFISGLEYSLPAAADADATPFVANLNAARNSFSLVISCPLVLWVPEYVLTAIARGAPDFFSIRSGVYFFAVTPQETMAYTKLLTAGGERAAANLTLHEKRQRIAAIKSLLDDYRSLPSTQQDRYTEARLLTRLGTLHETLGQWTEALEAYKQSLSIFRELGDRSSEGQTLNNLGNVYESQGRWSEAIAVYEQSLMIGRELGNHHGEQATLSNLGNIYATQRRWTEAMKAYEQSLDIFRELGDRYGEGQALNNLGIVYRTQGRWDEAIAIFEQSLTIYRELGTRHGEGQALGNLGIVYQAQGRWDEAITVFEQSLTICRELGDRQAEGQILGNLGNAYRRQGLWVQALDAYEQSLGIFHELGDRYGEGQTLGNLALLQKAQGDVAQALEYGRQALAVLQTTEDAALKKQMQKWITEWERQIDLHPAS